MTTATRKHKGADVDQGVDEQVVSPEDDTDAITGNDDDTDEPEPTEEPELDEDEPADTGTVSEARKYRHRAQAAERERDAAREELAAVREQLVTEQRGVIAEMCARTGLDPRLLKAAGFDLADLLDEDGNLDRQQVAEAIAIAAREFSGRKRPDPVPGLGNAGGSTVKGDVHATISKALGRS